MKFTRTIGLLALASSMALSACGGGGVGTTLNPQTQTTSTAATYTGPAPASPDVQAFEINLWANINSTNRCGGCHNATTPAQMPNFARADNVNLAYAQANLVVNLQQPSTSMMVTKVAGGHNCWLADPNACGSILTTWITNWANAANGGTTTQATVQLVAPPIQTVGQSLNLPNDGGIDYENTIYTITSVYCSRCHSPNASATQSPYFAGPVNQISADYQAAIPKIDFTGCVPFGTATWASTCGVNSRFYQRLATDSHNCWSNCQADAALMLAQIQAFANMLTPTNIDPALVISNALTLANGTVASGANRYDADTIAKYEFQTGNGYVAYDTSGVDPSADLTITGNVTWAGGWGLSFGAGGKAQATATGSQKFYNLIQATGEFSVEAWVAPALVAAKNSYMVSYSGSDTTRNFTLAQTNQDYDFMMRNSNTGLNGMPTLETPATADVLQASLQHVVLTYDAVNGRQIWVNGVNTGLVDPQKGGKISDWDQTFALVLGNEVSGDDSWQGLIKFVAIHSRAMTQAQIVQNFNAGVGEQYFMLFNVSSVTGLNEAYVMFTVSQFDSYSYLFAKPTFISLDPTVVPNNLAIAGIQIGINGAIPTGRPGVRAAQHHGDRGQLHRAGGSAIVADRHGDRPREWTARGSVLPGLQPARRQYLLGDGADLHAAAAGRAGAVLRPRCAHVRADQFDAVGAHGRAEQQYRGQCDLPASAAAAAEHTDARGVLLGQPGRCRANRGPILQHDGHYAVLSGGDLPGHHLQRLDVLDRGRHQCGLERARGARGRQRHLGEPAGAHGDHERAQYPDSDPVYRQRAVQRQFRACIGRDSRGLCRSVRQRRNDDRLI